MIRFALTIIISMALFNMWRWFYYIGINKFCYWWEHRKDKKGGPSCHC
jgi:hypothetical protein